MVLHRRGLPDTGPAVGTAAGAVFSFFVVTMAFLLVSSTGALATARQAICRGPAPPVDVSLAAERPPEPAGRQLREQAEAYLHQVIEVEWAQLEREETDVRTFGTPYRMHRIVQDLPPEVPALAAGDAHDAMAALLTQRRVRTATANDGAPAFLLLTLAGAAVLSVVFLVLLGWPKGARGLVAIAVVGGVFAFSIWLVVQIDHPYASGIRVMPEAFQEALERIALIRAAGY
ncbi:hypothetical protein GCM10009664_42300 [Kitasatospora gansuensis]